MFACRTLTRALSWRAWRVVAEASYDLYLLHPMVMLAVWSAFPPSSWFALPDPSPLAFLGATAAVFVVSLAAATAHGSAWRALLGRGTRARYINLHL